MADDPRWSRRRFLATSALGAAGLALAGCGLEQSSSPDPADHHTDAGFAGSLVSPPFAKPDLTFTTMDGKPFPFRQSTAGKLTILYFGYTHCPDYCPVFLSTIARAHQAIGVGPGSRPQVLFVGVDLKRDTPKVLKEYLGNIDHTFIGLTGSEHTIAQANAAFDFPPIEIGTPDKNGDYAVGHYAKAVIFTPDDKAHRFWPYDVRQQQVVNDLPRLAEGRYK